MPKSLRTTQLERELRLSRQLDLISEPPNGSRIAFRLPGASWEMLAVRNGRTRSPDGQWALTSNNYRASWDTLVGMADPGSLVSLPFSRRIFTDPDAFIGGAGRFSLDADEDVVNL